MVFKFTKKLIALIEIIIIGICILYTINYFSTNIDQKILEQEINSKHYNKIVKSIFKLPLLFALLISVISESMLVAIASFP